MSYDLFIAPKQFDARAILEWFGWREHYEVSETQALYANDDTGVDFTFDIVADPADGAPSSPHVHFNLNHVRPHIFALEAEPEIAAFLKAFESAIHDPQMKDMEAPWERQRFLNAWNFGNRFGFEAMGRHGKSAPPPWPADPALIEAVWTWNYGRAALQKTAGDQVFVPRITWFLPSGADAPVAACTWTDRVPTMIPEMLITHVALVRQPKQGLMGMLGLSRADKPKFELKLAGVKGIAHMPGMDRGDVHGQPVFYTPLVQTIEMNKLFSGAWPPDAAAIVPAEQVCGADLVALMKKG